MLRLTGPVRLLSKPTRAAGISLSAANLEKIASQGVSVPSYDRSKLGSGIVHLGVGGFHRAHQAVYTDMILAAGGQQKWGICGVGLVAPFGIAWSLIPVL